MNLYFDFPCPQGKRGVFRLNSVADVWTNVLTQLKRDLSETTIATWFDELEAVDIRDGVFYLFCPNDFKKNYIESLFMKNIKAVLHDIFSNDFEVKVLSADEYAEFTGGAKKKKSEAFTSDEFTFETFVVGPSNKLAYAASMSVAEHPAKNYNPLLIYGDSGLGKTHLIYSIAHVIQKNDRNAKIAYVKGDDLTNELFIAGRKQTQEEFFHTFNNLYESGKQIVLTSDRPPSEMMQLEDRLRTRFEWGLLVDVAPPDYETRMAIIKNKAALLGMEIPNKVAAYIAERVTSNVRQLEGTINKLLAYKDLLGNDVDEELVKRAIQDILRRGENIPTPESIVDFVSKYYGVDADVIRGQQRVREAVAARQVSMYLIRSMTNLSSDDIGKFFGNRDHSTVLYSIEKVEKQMKADAAFAETVKEIKTNISSKH